MDKEVSQEAIDYIDAWLVENGSLVDQRTLDFALDVRLIVRNGREPDDSMGIGARSAA